MSIDKETWLWVIVQDPGGNEMFLGQHDSKSGVSFVPAFYEKDEVSIRYTKTRILKALGGYR